MNLGMRLTSNVRELNQNQYLIGYKRPDGAQSGKLRAAFVAGCSRADTFRYELTLKVDIMLLQNDKHEKSCGGCRFRVVAQVTLQLAIATLAAAATDPPPDFEFSVVRLRSLIGLPLPKKEEGHLIFSGAVVTYRSQNGKTSIQLPYSDIRAADVSDPRTIRFETYDISKRNPLELRSYEFRLKADHGSDLAKFLAERLTRPVIGAYDVGGDGRFNVSAYHRHLFGGAHGVLAIGAAGIQFKTERKADSRTWLYRDIQTIGSSGPFNFRISTELETYTFDLKERLPERAYDFAWWTLYHLPLTQTLTTELVP